jgi:hypothetical protein
LEALADTPVDLTRMIVTDKDGQHSIWDQTWMNVTTERFEGGLVKLTDVEMFTEMWRCSTSQSNTIDFSILEEADCSNTCGNNIGCTLLENYNRYNQWSIHFKDGMGEEQEVTVITNGSNPDFDPIGPRTDGQWITSKDSNYPSLVLAPKKISHIIGTLRHLSFGRPAWILEPRRAQDCPDCKY